MLDSKSLSLHESVHDFLETVVKVVGLLLVHTLKFLLSAIADLNGLLGLFDGSLVALSTLFVAVFEGCKLVADALEVGGCVALWLSVCLGLALIDEVLLGLVSLGESELGDGHTVGAVLLVGLLLLGSLCGGLRG